jgi:hypothetical protein
MRWVGNTHHIIESSPAVSNPIAWNWLGHRASLSALGDPSQGCAESREEQTPAEASAQQHHHSRQVTTAYRSPQFSAPLSIRSRMLSVSVTTANVGVIAASSFTRRVSLSAQMHCALAIIPTCNCPYVAHRERQSEAFFAVFEVLVQASFQQPPRCHNSVLHVPPAVVLACFWGERCLGLPGYQLVHVVCRSLEGHGGVKVPDSHDDTPPYYTVTMIEIRDYLGRYISSIHKDTY